MSTAFYLHVFTVNGLSKKVGQLSILLKVRVSGLVTVLGNFFE